MQYYIFPFPHFMRFNPSHSLHIPFSHSMRFHPSHSSHIPFSHFLFQNPKRGKDKEPLLTLFPTPTPSFSSFAASPIFLFLSHKHPFLTPKNPFSLYFLWFSQPPNTHISLFSLILSTPKHISLISFPPLLQSLIFPHLCLLP